MGAYTHTYLSARAITHAHANLHIKMNTYKHAHTHEHAHHTHTQLSLPPSHGCRTDHNILSKINRPYSKKNTLTWFRRRENLFIDRWQRRNKRLPGSPPSRSLSPAIPGPWADNSASDRVALFSVVSLCLQDAQSQIYNDRGEFENVRFQRAVNVCRHDCQLSAHPCFACLLRSPKR